MGPAPGSDTSVGNLGGIVGQNGDEDSGGGTVTNCYNTGKLLYNFPIAPFSGNLGGVVGSNFNNSSITNCYSTGNIGSNNTPAFGNFGGVVGSNSGNSSVTNCYNTGNFGSFINSTVGGVVGNNGATVDKCYFLKTETVNAGQAGIGNDNTHTGATAVSDLTNQNEFKGWDFDNTWRISTDKKHPVLQANAEDNALSGTGTQEDPYKIYRAIDLKNFRDLVNGEVDQTADPDAHAKLMNNIDLSSVCGESNSWTPIGTSSNPYTDTFNGQNFKISGLYINSNTDYQGLFGFVGSTGTVQKLSVEGTITVTASSSGDSTSYIYVGGIVAYNNGGSVTNCTSTVAITATTTEGGISDVYVGGVVGENFDSTVTNCYNTGEVISGNIGGGVVGLNGSGSVTNCYNTGSITGRTSGGVLGFNDGGSVKNCYNTGSVSVVGTGSSSVAGGVVGENRNGASVTNCYFLQTADVNENLPSIGKNEGNSDDATGKTDTAFHSGEVAWRLQDGQTDGSSQVWGQSKLEDENSWPTLIALDDSAQLVYKVTVVYGDYADAPETETSYTNNPTEPAAPSRDGYTFDRWDKTGEGTTTITYTAKWTENAPDPDPEPTPEPEPEEPPYSGKYSYEISTDVGDNGTLTVDRYATEGDTVTIEITPDQAYKLDDLSVTANGKDVDLTANSDGTYSFTMPSADVRISATFAEDPDWTKPEPEPEPSTDVSDLFIDVAPNAWYKDAVQYAYDNGLMTGTSATEFAPEATTTRAMIVSILARLEGVERAEAAGFADVNDEWYATAVNWAANVGVVNGYEDNTFRPNQPITREQLAAILMNYASYKGEDVSARADLSNYTDQPSAWATETMQWAVAEGLISGVTADQLQPQGNATRAQVAAILQRFLCK